MTADSLALKMIVDSIVSIKSNLTKLDASLATGNYKVKLDSTQLNQFNHIKLDPTTLFLIWIVAIFIIATGVLIVYKIMFDKKSNISTLISEPPAAGQTIGDASMSRLQLLIFTFVIAICILFCVANTGFFPEINANILALIGISGGTYVISKGIQTSRDTQLNETNNTQSTQNIQTQAAAALQAAQAVQAAVTTKDPAVPTLATAAVTAAQGVVDAAK